MLYSLEKWKVGFFDFLWQISFQSIAVIENISPSLGSVKVILIILEIAMVIR